MSTVHYLNNEQIPFTALEVTILPPTPPMNPPIAVPIPGQTMVPIAAPAVAPAYPPPMLAVLVAAVFNKIHLLTFSLYRPLLHRELFVRRA